MEYDEIAKLAADLPRADKLKLSEYLKNLALIEQEKVQPVSQLGDNKLDNLDYVLGRIKKSKPTKLETLFNFIKAMFQFKGGISDDEINIIIKILVDREYIKIVGNKISYLA